MEHLTAEEPNISLATPSKCHRWSVTAAWKNNKLCANNSAISTNKVTIFQCCIHVIAGLNLQYYVTPWESVLFISLNLCPCHVCLQLLQNLQYAEEMTVLCVHNGINMLPPNQWDEKTFIRRCLERKARAWVHKIGTYCLDSVYIYKSSETDICCLL